VHTPLSMQAFFVYKFGITLKDVVGRGTFNTLNSCDDLETQELGIKSSMGNFLTITYAYGRIKHK